MDIYVQKNGQQLGPFSEAKIRDGMATGEFAPTDLAAYDGGNTVTLTELLGEAARSSSEPDPTVLPPIPQEPSSGGQDDGKLVLRAFASAGLCGLALLFGIGGHTVLWFLGTLAGIVLGHQVRKYTRSQPDKRFVRRLARVGLVIGYGTVSVYLAFQLLVLVVDGIRGSSDSAPVAQSQPTRVEERIKDQVQAALNQNKQQIFDAFHPLGTAKSVTLHDVSVTAWKRGKNTNRIEDIQELGIRYTLYWSTPMTEDGFTKVAVTFDAESQRYTNAQILATNGVTNQDAKSALGTLAGALLQYQAQKAGAQEAADQYYQHQ